MQPNAMPPREFAAYHLPALERDEARHNLIVAVLGRLAGENPPELLLWSLGEPGQCAIEAPGYPIVLGDMNAAQCHALAEATRSLDYPAVVGADETARWFVERATELGVTFREPIPQQILVLCDKPVYPGVPGQARKVDAADTPLFSEWMTAFSREGADRGSAPIGAADADGPESGQKPASLAGNQIEEGIRVESQIGRSKCDLKPASHDIRRIFNGLMHEKSDLRPIARMHFSHYVLDVHLNGSLGQIKLISDSLILLPFPKFTLFEFLWLSFTQKAIL